MHEAKQTTTSCRNKAFSPVSTILNILDDQLPWVASLKLVNGNVKVLWYQSHPCRKTAVHQDHRSIRSVRPAQVFSHLLLLWFNREDCLHRGTLAVQWAAATGSGWLRGQGGPWRHVEIWDCRRQKLGRRHLLKMGFPPEAVSLRDSFSSPRLQGTDIGEK